MTALPASFQHANKAAIAAALAENTESIGADIEPGEIQEVDMQAQADDIRTVFSHPTSFNVKVRNRIDSPLYSINISPAQHPLYSPWTLWFDSPATKGRNLPQTPVSSFPQTPVPQTPSAAAAQGWMEDIKRVVSFDSVEEFWGQVFFSPISKTVSLPRHSLYNHIVPPSQLPQKANYYLFKVRVSHGLVPVNLTALLGGYYSCMGG
jgi:translation initiation factor 4E